MKANKRVRDLSRRSEVRLISKSPSDGMTRGVTTWPFLALRESKEWPDYAAGKRIDVSQDYHPHVKAVLR